MTRPNLERELARALGQKQIGLIGQEYGLHPQAAEDVARRIMSGLYLDDHAELACRSGETVEGYIRAKLAHMQREVDTAHLFAGIEAGAETKAARTPPLHSMSARQKLDLSNGVDPFAGL